MSCARQPSRRLTSRKPDRFLPRSQPAAVTVLAGQRGEGGPGPALVHDRHERAAPKLDLPFAPGVRGKGGSSSAVIMDGLKKKGKDKASPEAIALKAKAKCQLLDALGQPGSARWDFNTYPKANCTTNVYYCHPVLARGRGISYAQAQNAARG